MALEQQYFSLKTNKVLVQKGDDNFYDVILELEDPLLVETWKTITLWQIYNEIAFTLDDQVFWVVKIEGYILDGKIVLYNSFSEATAQTLASLIKSPNMKFGGQLKAIK